MKTKYDEIREVQGLPRTGQYVRSTKYGTFWKVVEEREEYRNGDDDPVTKEARLIPAVRLVYEKVTQDQPNGTGKKMEYQYTTLDVTFQFHWEVFDRPEF